MWSVHFDEQRKEYFIINGHEPRSVICVPEGNEADAMNLALALEQAKAKPRFVDVPKGLLKALLG
jgi:hypothetical protein